MKLPLTILLFGFLVGCVDNGGSEKETLAWIKIHKHPIAVNYGGESEIGNRDYTLIAADGEIYRTKYISLALPDTLK